MVVIKTLIVITIILQGVSGQECVRGPDNPLGTCDCDGQQFIGKDCRFG